MTVAYTTLAELKALLPANNWGTTYDAVLSSMALTASREIDTFLRREPGAFSVINDSTRYFDGNGSLELWIDEMAALPTAVLMATSAYVDDATGAGGTYSTLAVADYVMWPRNALTHGMPFNRIDLNPMRGAYSEWYPYPNSVKITGKFGFSSVPPLEVRKATEIQVMRYFKRAQQAFSDTGTITELSQLTYTKSLDPDVKQILMSGKFATVESIL